MAQIASRGRWQPAPHLMLLNDLMLLVARFIANGKGGIKRLLVTTPPRHGKSLFLSQYCPAWFLGMFPDLRVILTSYESDFAATSGRKCRDLLTEYGPAAFGVRVSQTSSAANRWDFERADGGMVTAGAGGPITGKGAHLGIIDDPIKNSEQALSPLHRSKLEEWYKSTFYTRLEPNAACIMIQTRWHDEDLAGMRIKAMEKGGEEWLVVNLPAIALEADVLGRKPGEALWPERYTVEDLERIRGEIGTQWFESLYQQRPLTEQGAMFKRENFRPLNRDKVPDGVECRFWDLAATEARHGADPDWTAGVHLRRFGENYCIMDIARDRKTPLGVEGMIQRACEEDGFACSIRMEEEGGSSGKSVTSYYRRGILAMYDFKGVRSTGSKIVRAHNFSRAVESGKVFYCPAEWNKDFFDEIERFPLGTHDDQVDAASGAFNELSKGASMILEGVYG